MSGAQSVGGVITFARQYTHAETSLGYTTRLPRMEPPRGKDFGYRIGVGARGVGGTDSSSDALIDAQFVSLSSCLGYTGGP